MSLFFGLFVLLFYFDRRFQYFVVTSGSMSPSIQIGDLLLVQKQNTYQKNDVVTFHDSNSRLVTHRLVDYQSPFFTTAGDANRSFDHNRITNSQILGKVVFVLPKLGKIFSHSLNPFFLLFCLFLPLLYLLLIRKYPLFPFLLIIICFTLFRSQPTSADLNDEITVTQNHLAATTLEFTPLNSTDNSPQNYLFNINHFSPNGINSATLRVKNNGQQKNYFTLSTNFSNTDPSCATSILKLIQGDQFIFNGPLKNLNWQSPPLDSNQYLDLVFILNNPLSTNLSCHYQILLTTTKANFSDINQLDNHLILVTQ